uniref:Uncharacterized protein n=1 Tax=Cannabis sativa TaxID=3483 RepID=A0A803Q9W6_CANSA
MRPLAMENLVFDLFANCNSVAPTNQQAPPTARGMNFSRFNQRVVCQVCMRLVMHTTAVCHYRFDKNWTAPKQGYLANCAFFTELKFDCNPQAYITTIVQDFHYNKFGH